MDNELKGIFSGPVSRSGFLRAMVLGLPALAASAATAAEVAAGAKGVAPMTPDAGNLRAFVELARSDLRTQKALIVAENMDFTEAEAVEFWPLHREYDLELGRWLDDRLALIARFVAEYGAISDAEAGRIARAAFDLEERRIDLKRKYFKKFSRVVAPRKAARFFQIENQLQMALDLQVAAALPLLK